MNFKTYRTSKAFPAEVGEKLQIRNGAGSVVERWTCTDKRKGDDFNYVTYCQEQVAAK